MKKVTNILITLSSLALLTGCATSNLVRKTALKATGEERFPIITNLDEVMEIHTERQKEYLSYDGDYVEIPEENYPDGTKHLSDPEPVKLEWDYNSNLDKTILRYDVEIGKDPALKDGYVVKGSAEKSIDIYNSYLGDNYFRIIAQFTDGSNDRSNIFKYKVDDVYPRNLRIEGMTNCRDMGGGRELVDGGYIKQGMIYRTSATSSWAYGRGDVPDTITTSGKEELLTHLGCKTEINVNNSGSNQIGIQNYVEAYMWYDSGKHHLYRNAEPIKTVFKALANPDNYPVFYHCRIGTDRTGLCAILISGLLGVPENLIYQDYLFSNFGNIQEKRYIGDKAGRDNILNYINDLKAFPGEEFHNKVYNYLLSIGLTAEELDSIIDILVEGNKPITNDNYQEMILAEDMNAEGCELQTSTNRANPSHYYTLGEGQSVYMDFDMKYSGKGYLVAYLGSRENSSKKINESIKAEVDGNEVFISDDRTFADAGFGTGDGRTYYSAVVLGEIDVYEGQTYVNITGLANNLNIGAVSIIPDGIVKSHEPIIVEPDVPDTSVKKGCNGSIIGASSLLSLIAVGAVSFLVTRRKED